VNDAMNAPPPRLPLWPALFDADARASLADALWSYARPRRWFRAKTRSVRQARVVDLVPLSGASLSTARSVLALLELEYDAGESDWYAIPLAHVGAAAARTLRKETPHAIVAHLGDGSAADAEALVDGLATGQAAGDLFDLARAGRACVGEAGRVRGEARAAFGELGDALWSPTLSRGEQTNSTIAFEEKALLKIYRRLTAGPNPELEMGLFLSAQPRPPRTPRILGALSYRGEGEARSLGIVHEFLPNDGDAWSLTLRELRDYFARAARTAPAAGGGAAPLGRFRDLAATLGIRTAEMHLALGRAGIDEPAFAPEPLSTADRQAAVARVRSMLEENLSALSRQLPGLTAGARASAERLLSPATGERLRIEALLSRFQEAPIAVLKTRIHGDLHLGQVLVRGDDFVIIDFEGEPARPLAERRSKASPLRDVMGMARSFSYAPEAVLRESPEPDAERRRARAVWAAAWTRDVNAVFRASYLAAATDAPFIPRDAGQLSLMLAFHELERVVYEVGYEINNRPDWVEIPLGGLVTLAEEEA
jgi:trehalose synthase-fused probable maltokinase